MEMKCTPGPWEVYQLNHADNELWLIIGHEGIGPITELCGQAVKEISPVARMRFLITPDEEQRANARLIAAAPRLLEALMDIRAKARFEQEYPTGLHMTCFSLIEKAADTAIAETEGRQPTQAPQEVSRE